jgi:hypothetical protein
MGPHNPPALRVRFFRRLHRAPRREQPSLTSADAYRLRTGEPAVPRVARMAKLLELAAAAMQD